MEIVYTKDKSPTLFSSKFDQTYHSIHGAVSESQHVFIQNGLELLGERESIAVFEMGYGTGLNAMLTYLNAQSKNLTIYYESIEKYPVLADVFTQIRFEDKNMEETTLKLNQLEWDRLHSLTQFKFKKLKMDIKDYIPNQKFDVVYFDAFSPNSQPDLWSKRIFDKMYSLLNPGGVLTTYCAKGEVKRTLKACGFKVEARPGPIGKREMTIGIKD